DLARPFEKPSALALSAAQLGLRHHEITPRQELPHVDETGHQRGRHDKTEACRSRGAELSVDEQAEDDRGSTVCKPSAKPDARFDSRGGRIEVAGYDLTPRSRLAARRHDVERPAAHPRAIDTCQTPSGRSTVTRP